MSTEGPSQASPLHRWRERAPGLTLVALLTISAYAFLRALDTRALDAAALGVVVGLLVGNLVRVKASMGPGVRFAGKQVLALAVALLGLRVTLRDLVSIGPEGLVVVLVAVAGALVLALVLAPLLGVSRAMAALIGGGTGICGVATIAALKEVVDADTRELAYAIGAITMFASLGLVVFPLLQLAWHPLAPTDYGVVAGATLHSVPQAVGAGFAGGGLAAGASATLVKLARVSLLGPAVVVTALALKGRAGGTGAALKLPLEVWGFLSLFALASLVELPARAVEFVVRVDEVLLVAALTALGLQTRFADLRHTGVRPLVLAGVVWVALIVVVVGIVWML